MRGPNRPNIKRISHGTGGSPDRAASRCGPAARTGIALVGASLSRLAPPCAAQGRFSRLHGSDESFTPADEIFLLRASAQSLDAERHHLAYLGTYVGVGVGTLQPGNLASVRCLVLGHRRRAAANAREARIPEQGARARTCACVSSPATRTVLALGTCVLVEQSGSGREAL